jgi:hypothetical protein
MAYSPLGLRMPIFPHASSARMFLLVRRGTQARLWAHDDAVDTRDNER